MILYPSNSQEAGLKDLYENMRERVKKNSSANLDNMVEFVLNCNYFEFGCKVKKQVSGTVIVSKFAPPYACVFMDKVERESDCKVKKQISGVAIGTKFAPPYTCVFMDKVEREFLNAEDIKPWVWLRYIDDIYFIWTESENMLDGFLLRLNISPQKPKTYTREVQNISQFFQD